MAGTPHQQVALVCESPWAEAAADSRMLLREVQLPSEEGLQKSRKKQQDCHTADKTCFYFTPDSSGSFSCAEIRAVSTSSHFPLAAAHQHKLYSPEHTSPSWTKVQQKTTAQGREIPFKAWEVESER